MMCSIPVLPSPGSNVPVLIARVNTNPSCVLVEFWANFKHEKKLAYQELHKEIQSYHEKFCDSDGNPGDLCLVQVYETWYRARIVSRSGSRYRVFLIDEARTLSATTSILAWGQSDFFHLPPEVEFCVLANVLPLSPENRWSPMALEFLKTFCGKTVTAYVQDVIISHQTFLLDVPCLSQQMYEMGFAKKMPADCFKVFVAQSLQAGHDLVPPKFPFTQNEPVGIMKVTVEEQKYMYPELQAETVETVVITEVTNPLRLFCQLKVFSQELKKLTERMTKYYEGRVGVLHHSALGSPCAARGSDGKWYRGSLQQIMATNSAVEIFQVDYGKKQFVKVENIRPLAPEFFQMPVVTYVCSLHGIIDRGIGWTLAQIDYLKSLLLNRTVIAKFEYQSISEGVHYVALFGEENTNINRLFGLKERCLMETEMSFDNTLYKMPSEKALDSKGSEMQKHAPASPRELQENTSVAVVQYVCSPSEFWIQSQTYAAEFDEMMADLAALYRKSACVEGLVRNPCIGSFCAARAQDDLFYRGKICEICGKTFKVYFIDYGNTELVEWVNLRELPTKFQKLPATAMKCALAGIKPLGDGWSKKASSFFESAVLDKIVEVLIIEKIFDKHVVQLFDAAVEEQKDIGQLLCASGFAKSEECVRLKHPIGPQLQQCPKPKSLDLYKANVSQALCPSVHAVTESRCTFKEYLFSIGSSVEVKVSFIESPNDFWCQIANNAGCLKFLMQDLQNYYSNTEIEQPIEAACVARHPENGMWYRALVIHKHADPYVDVLFVDYGQTKTVALQDLRPIHANFLKLNGQAFRCSLYNLIHPVSQSSEEWSEDATLHFQEFVHDATSMCRPLKCTIYAVMYDSQKVVFNVVDLETPFQSVCSLLVERGLAKRAPAKKAPPSPFRLDTYYYSTHNIKTGSEEDVTVTCVKGVSHFYCQLGRNSDMIKELADKVSYLCHQLEFINCPQTFGTVCFAKYTDGEWYRGQIKATKPAIVVHFVDYGDTLEVDKSDLLPIPIEAGEIMSVPVQAVECALSDIPENVPSEVNSWFKMCVTDHTMKALVVAKDPDGKLKVELYDNKAQINAQIKHKFHIKIEKELVFLKGRDIRKTGLSCKSKEMLKSAVHEVFQQKESAPSSFRRRDTTQQATQEKWNTSFPGKFESETQFTEMNVRTAFGSEPLGPPPTQENKKRDLIQETAGTHLTEGGVGFDTTGLHTPRNHDLPKHSDLPENSVKPGMELEVFVSHYNSPLSFFVQLNTDEDEIYSLVEKINADQMTGHLSVKDLNEGDLVNAEFPEDRSWYRAVVKDKRDLDIVEVEFIDFGNTAFVQSSKICKLPRPFLDYPRFSIHCALHGAKKLDAGNEEVLQNFKMEIDENSIVKCHFIEETDDVWEVILKANNVTLGCKLLVGGSMQPPTDQIPKNGASHSVSLEISKDTPGLLKGQRLEVYASFITGPQYFWCQYAQPDALQQISDAVQVAGNSSDIPCISAESVCVGNVCIALFSEDELWYRAEILSKDHDSASILFVDYGNESRVKLNEIKMLPLQLANIPPQAFLCHLEGFEDSKGVWHDQAFDCFFGLLSDKLLKVTIMRPASSEDQKAPHIVKVESEGQVINDFMKDYWVDPRLACNCHQHERLTGPEVSLQQSSMPDHEFESTMDVSSSEQVPDPAYNHTREDTEAENVCLLSEVLESHSKIFDSEETPIQDRSVDSLNAFSEFEATLECEDDREAEKLSVELPESSCDLNSPLQSQTESTISICTIPPCQEKIINTTVDTEPVLCTDETSEESRLLTRTENEENSNIPTYQSSENSESGSSNPAEIVLPQLGKFRRVSGRGAVGLDCVVWSYSQEIWCQAKILKIVKDYTLVLLLDHDSEMVVDPQNIYVKVSEALMQGPFIGTDALRRDQQIYLSVEENDEETVPPMSGFVERHEECLIEDGASGTEHESEVHRERRAGAICSAPGQEVQSEQSEGPDESSAELLTMETYHKSNDESDDQSDVRSSSSDEEVQTGESDPVNALGLSAEQPHEGKMGLGFTSGEKVVHTVHDTLNKELGIEMTECEQKQTSATAHCTLSSAHHEQEPDYVISDHVIDPLVEEAHCVSLEADLIDLTSNTDESDIDSEGTLAADKLNGCDLAVNTMETLVSLVTNLTLTEEASDETRSSVPLNEPEQAVNSED
ncbi:tudor domain-containing 6 isoform X2 [Denticeps clupeoides]|uniref:tudor domain-containing 6 isoform X2 n=1 Tax=Denticeps clupeoides TaxID=299321 RepID=UPI0010A424D5|nr:tudor domain-containing protein 6 isoform X2 [Denticeps clupeoides]